MKELLDELNEEQLLPVKETEGAVLVSAGAGSGKTRVLTHHIAYLLQKGVMPYNILAITFTNKAASEMRTRLEKMTDIDGIWIHTFHAMCVRILRRYGDRLGYTKDFSIYGDKETEQCIKKIIKDKGLADEDILKTVTSSISEAKNYALTPKEYLGARSGKENIELICEIYDLYEKELVKCNALDYDNLLIKTLFLLKNDAEVREYYRNKFKYVHIDEFQDTNKVQYEIIKCFAYENTDGSYSGNIFIVGDEDQSIYGWRGANFANMSDFIKNFHAKVFKLERNYRSTSVIIEKANLIIKNNKDRLDKNLWTSNKRGEDIVFFEADSDSAEADYVVREIVRLNNLGYSYSDMAILMRINSLSRAFEERLIMYGIPHRLSGGFKFYERKEVKDLLAYLKISVNHYDNDAILRIINFPKRGIGESAFAQLVNYASLNNMLLYDVIFNIDKNLDFPSSFIKKIMPFSNVLQCMQNAKSSECSIYEYVRYIIKIINLKDAYADDTDENNSRKDNIRELLNSIKEFEESNGSVSPEEYLQAVSLYSDSDSIDDAGGVNIATVHSAKGLEFPIVFIVGVEEGIFPDSRRAAILFETEEERRLMYVAVTRAKEILYITCAKSRYRYGKRDYSMPSSFIYEMALKKKEPKKNIEVRFSDTVKHNYNIGNTVRPVSVSAKNNNCNGNVATKSNSVNIDKFAVGKKVKHKKFGIGIIAKSENGSIEVIFENAGKLTLMAEYAPIEIID